MNADALQLLKDLDGHAPYRPRVLAVTAHRRRDRYRRIILSQ